MENITQRCEICIFIFERLHVLKAKAILFFFLFFFFFFVECIFWFCIGRSEKKKKVRKKKKKWRSVELRGTVPQPNIHGVWRQPDKKWGLIFVAAKTSELQMQQHGEIIRRTTIRLWWATVPTIFILATSSDRKLQL